MLTGDGGSALCILHGSPHLITSVWGPDLLRQSVALLSQEDLESLWGEVVAIPRPGFSLVLVFDLSSCVL